MDITEFEVLLNRGEDSRLQFKKDFTNAKAIALELVVFSNAPGGQLLKGVDDSGNVSGLSSEDINRLNQLLSNAASENTVPPVYPLSEVFEYEDKKVMIVTVPYSAGKPFATKDGKYVTKAGSDKRMISNDEMRRLYQESGKMFAEETPFRNGEWDDIDSDYFIRRNMVKILINPQYPGHLKILILRQTTSIIWLERCFSGLMMCRVFS
ncbi:MAG: AlbA family DNA-binding domain-containing protein [Candidatus Anammoxibacter sp.]